MCCRSAHKVLITPALSLLNTHGAQFDVVQVLELLPHNWPIMTVQAFLMRSIRGSMDAQRTGKIEYHLARGENLQVSWSSLLSLCHNLDQGNTSGCMGSGISLFLCVC